MTEPVAYLLSDRLAPLPEVIPAWRINDFRHLNGARWTVTPLYAGAMAGGPAERALADDILSELVRARAKFPGKNVTFAALSEEVGELATALFEEGSDRVRHEAVQVAVMAMRVVLDGDHCFDDWRRDKGLDPLDPALRGAGGEP